jgi:hypothetical protein
MALSAFDDRQNPPGDAELAEVLAGTHAPWQELKAGAAERFAPMSEKWGFSGKAWGWGLRLARSGRAILYLTPRHGHFLVGFALGEKAVRAAHESDLPASVLEAIDSARKYAEGRGVRLEVRKVADVRNALALAGIKMAN